jgi:hypothetical protein
VRHIYGHSQSIFNSESANLIQSCFVGEVLFFPFDMASAADFLNPWFGRPSPSLPIKGHLSEGPPENGIDVYEPFDLPVIGQGTIAIQSSAKELLQITVNSKDLGGPSLVLFIAKDKWKLVSVDATGVQSDIVKDLKPIRSDEDCWLETSKDPSDKALYWLSIDKAFGRLRYGKRFINTSMTSLETVLKEPDPNDKDDTKTWIWKDPTRDQWMEQLLHVEIVADGEKLEVCIVFQESAGLELTNPKDLDDIVLGEVPLVTDLSPYVVTDEEIDLETLENGHFTVPANLPQACQRLYNNIAGKSVSLNTSKYPYFSKAIQYSCETPGCWAYEKLWAKAKKGELGNDILGTYLRITLGYNQVRISFMNSQYKYLQVK